MKKNQHYDIIICGGGAAGLLLAHGLLQDNYFDNFRILILEKKAKNKNDRTWCFWENGSGKWDHLLHKQWDNAHFQSDTFESVFSLAPYRYKMLRGIDFYQSLFPLLEKANNITLVYTEVTEIIPESTHCQVNTNQEQFTSSRVFSSIPHRHYLKQQKYPVLQQHFVGWLVTTQHPIFDPSTVNFMDFALPQKNNTRFMYVLPFDHNTALVEYTLFSATLLDHKEYEQAIQDYLQAKGGGEYKIVEKEQGSIPMTAYDFNQHNQKCYMQIGTAGGWTKASTGFTFKKTERKVHALLEFLKTNRPLNQFDKKTKYHFYDLLFLDVLAKYNGEGSQLFTQMFRNNTPQRIFAFLDEKSTALQELRIMLCFPVGRFVLALVKRLLNFSGH